jgi:putative CocE/NonD family hydrolase
VTSALTVEFDVPARMRDGTILRANVYRPAGDGSWPVLLSRTPYGKDFAFGGTGIDPAAAVKRGYILVIQDTRGRFESGGEWSPMRHEIEDGADTIAWAAAIRGSTGAVAMHGGSYLGFTQWAAAHGGSPALKAIAPAITWCDPYDGLAYRDGALEFGTLVSWSFSVGVDVLSKRYQDDAAARFRAMQQHAAQYDAMAESGFFSLPLQAFPPLESQRSEAIFYETLAAERNTESDLFRRVNVRGWADAHQIPAFNVGGWYDIFLAGTIANYQQGHPESRLLIGPWAHAPMSNPIGERNFGFAAQAGSINLETDLASLQLDWFDRWCKGTEAPDTPRIRIFVMGTNRWRYEKAWPLERATTTPWYFGNDGDLSGAPPADTAPEEFVYDPDDPVPTLGGATLLTPEFRAGAYDQRTIEERSDVLTYTSPPLAADLEVTGPIEMRLWAPVRRRTPISWPACATCFRTGVRST